MIIMTTSKTSNAPAPAQTARQAQGSIDAILADMAAPGNGKGLVPATMRLTVSKDALTNSALLPKQCQLVLNYLTALGGSATIAEVNQLAERAKGAQAWGRNDGQPYEQSPQKIIGHYMAKLTGSAEWSKSKGKVRVLTA
jgi:hypothetical protein